MEESFGYVDVPAQTTKSREMKTSETDLVRACLQWLKLAKPRGVWWRANTGAVTMPYTSGHPCGSKRRFVRFGEPGMSDIQGVCDGAAWFIECKMPKGKLSASQVAFRDAVGKAGAFYAVARSIQDLEQVFD
jgi:hypothetical protein